MATKQIQDLPLGVVSASQELPVQESGATTKLSLATIKDWIMSGWTAMYDPTGIGKSPFDRANHTGTQPIATVVNALNKTGDTVSGVLLLPAADPTVANQAATKAYVDKAAGGFPDAVADSALYGRVNNAWGKALPLTGGTLTGGVHASAGLTVSGGVNVASGGAVVNGTLNAGANAVYGGPGVFSGQVNAANVYSAGQVNCGSVYARGRVQVDSTGGGFDYLYGSAVFTFGSSITWNSINVNPSSYPIYIAFAGSNYFTFQTDRLAPVTSGGPILGTSSQRWDRVYSVNADSVSSDVKLKTDIRPFNETELAVAKEIKAYLRMFRMKDAPQKIHAGVIAQDMETLFAEHGLDIKQYAFYEIDEDMSYETNAEGQSVETPTGEFTRSIVYPELLVWLMAAME